VTPVAGRVDRSLAWLLGLWAVLSLLPVGAWAGLAPLDYFAAAWGLWLRTLLVVVLATVLLLVLSRGGAPAGVRRLLTWSVGVRRPVFLLGLGLGAALEAVLVAVLCFDRGAESVDAWIQLFQARVFLSGALVAPPPPSIGHFATLHALITPRGWCSQYPPLHAALLAVGLAAGQPWLVTPVLAALLPPAVYLLGRRTGDERVARLAAALVLLSPFVVAIDASAMNHLPAALAAAVGLWALPDLAAGSARAGLVCGAAAGVLLGLRPLEGALLGGLGGLALLGALRRGVGWGAVAATALAGVVTVAPTLVYNAVTTGSPLTYTYSALWGSGLRLGLEHDVPWGHPLTFLRALAYTATDAHQLDVYLLEWPVPVTVLAAAGLWLARGRVAVGLRPVAAWVLALAGALFFYFHRDVLYGPRFLFSAVPAVLVLVAAGLVGLADVRRPLGWRGIAVGDAAVLAVAVIALLSATTLGPRRLASYATVGTALALHPDEDARRAGITHAVVLIPDGWGTRLIVRMWAAGLSALDSERLYKAFDACGLEERLAAAELAGDRGDALAARLGADAVTADPGQTAPGVTRDPLLRLPSDHRLTPRCAAEITRDQQGTLQFAPYLYLDAPTLDGDVVWARELGEADAALRRLYPDRAFYRYAPPSFTRLE
jgi:hypothetical protein